MKTKIIALLLALVVVLGAFASCNFGGNSGNSGDGKNPNIDGGNGTYPWGKTKLLYQMTNNSNYQELGSTCKRYLAGNTEGVTDPDTVDTLVKARNAAADAAVNVEVEYSYRPDTADFSWGQNVNKIHQEVLNNAANAPDIYCNFVYDMVAASLKGSFANLLSTTMHDNDGSGYAGSEYNYFAFEDDFTMVDNEKGEGYMLRYMRSLTLSKYKMYCLSSDYYTDMVRAFLVVPVNIKLLEEITVTSEPHMYNSDRADAETGEAIPDGDYTIEDFYQLVWDKEWNYQTLMDFSSAIYSNEGGATEGQDVGDRLGFALPTSSGLSASGMLYTTSFEIIHREYDTTKGDYTYSYPQTKTEDDGKTFKVTGSHTELNNFCTAITALVNTDGVVAVSDKDAADHVGVSGTGAALRAIRQQFAANRILFGGVICLGSLEYDEYAEMNGNNKAGYGIVPVPLYRGEYKNAAGEMVTDEYQTQVHNIGRVGAISKTTDKFAQCTAYLNYQSLNSTDILDEYYNFKLQYNVVGTKVTGNVEMLKYIRANVRSSFDKAYEDALGIFYSTQTENESRKQQWHTLIMTGTNDMGYVYTSGDMTNAYESFAHVKAKRLYDLEYITFPALPN